MKILEKRNYQERIHEKSLNYLNQPKTGIAKTLMIESPTGSGKTVMAMKLAKWLEKKGHERIGWIAHRRELLKQAEKCNKDFFQVQNLETISLFTRTPEDYEGCTAVIIDESQHDASASAAILHQVIRPEIIIGLTATPYRTDRAQLCFQKVIKDAGIHQLIREGYLAEFQQWVLEDKWTPENVARSYLADQDTWGKTVIYFLTIAEATKCDLLLKRAGVASELIVGHSPRDKILEDFSEDKLEVLVNVSVLTEGFDCPSLKTCFVRPGSKGPTVQMSGRAFRKHPTTPIVNIVQNKDTKYPFTRHATALGQFKKVGTNWMSIDPKNLQPFFRQQINKLVKARVELPEYLRKENKNVIEIGEGND